MSSHISVLTDDPVANLEGCDGQGNPVGGDALQHHQHLSVPYDAVDRYQSIMKVGGGEKPIISWRDEGLEREGRAEAYRVKSCSRFCT